MPDGDAFNKVAKGLLQADRGLYIAPIRHHSPACAWAVRALIDEVKPAHVLVEAPQDFTALIPLLLDGDTKPPVAIAALVEETSGRRLAGYYPFCSHSPEFVALQAGQRIGADLSFIDMPSAAKTAWAPQDSRGPVPLVNEAKFDSGDYIQALTRHYGCRDGFELWDHLFESRLGEEDWRGLLTDIGAYCAGIRASTHAQVIENQGDAARELYMGAQVHAALQAGGGVVVVAGGFHAPALIDMAAQKKAPKPAKVTAAPDARSYLIRYGFAALDALSGYGAGLPQPGYYEELWQRANVAGGAPQWRETAQDLTHDFTVHAREEGHPVGLPAQVEMLRVAESLALLRGRPGIMRHDLFDGARAALVKGEAGRSDAWSERLALFLRGDALGDVPASAGSPPLVEDARAQARKHRIDISDSARRRRHLDIRRKPAHLKASQFLHAMALLGAGFAEREAGPDYVQGIQTELLFEDWSYAWSPLVEGRLIELAAKADRVEGACLATLLDAREEMATSGQAKDIPRLVHLLAIGLQAGLGEKLDQFLSLIAGDIQTHADFVSIAGALQRLFYINRSAGPLGAPETLDLNGAARAAYARLIYLCDDLPSTRDEDISSRLDALRLVAELLRGDAAEMFDASLFEQAVNRVAAAQPPAEILGAVLAICVQSGLRHADELTEALAGHFAGAAIDAGERTGVLRGLIHTAPNLLWQSDGVLQGVDAYLCAMAPEDFIQLLPHLRLAFAGLNPREVDRVADILAKVHGGGASSFAASTHRYSEADLSLGLQLETSLTKSLQSDGLAAWLEEEGAV